ncbi:MAG: 50S ribosomal protein L5 [Candidatus Eisenbacteria bacterium]|nr:50S ribosomal protein L5 [Candidatus Latescibacterota bacterium]MBD3301965.1 50S ribosomal protein L5 [Candidatus Eisenbacteria bacterium]
MNQKAKKAKKGKGDAEGTKVAVGLQDPPAESVSQTRYRDDVIPQLMKRFGYKSVMQVPRISKIVVNMGVGDSLQNIKLLDAAVADLTTITGQRPTIRRARKSIANFKLRAGSPIGATVTLRGRKMWEFMDRLQVVSIPKIRDFRGLSQKSFDGRGNYTLGLKEQVIFPEIRYDKVEKVRGMDITFVTTADTDEEGLELLRAMKWPFRER